MKIRNSIIWFTIIAAVLIALVLWYGRKKSVEMPPIVSIETNTTPPATAAPSPPVIASVQTNAPVVKAATGTNAGQSPTQGKWAQIQQILANANDEPIVFYGKIEDQFSNSVPGAQINASIRIENGAQHTVERFSLASDANGLFTISGYNGESLGIGVEKPGYVFVSMNGSGIYSTLWPEDQRAHPDPNNPTLIKMWKLQGAEPLVNINQRYKLHYTAEPLNFDLLAGQIVPSGGDISIIVNRPGGDVSERTMQDWSVQVEAVNGGLMEADGQEGVTYAAPESGYAPSETFTMSTSTHSWRGAFNQGVFLESRNGQVYSKVTFGIAINQNPDGFMYITFNGVANTNSSRNWEATVPQ